MTYFSPQKIEAQKEKARRTLESSIDSYLLERDETLRDPSKTEALFVDTKAVSAKQLAFGVELECSNLTPEKLTEAVDAGLAKSFDQATVERLRPTSLSWKHGHVGAYSKWSVQPDSSISLDGRNCVVGYEVVSRIVRGEAGLAEIFNVVEALKRAGARANQSCGLHIHVAANKFTKKDLVETNLWWATTVEPCLLATISPLRRAQNSSSSPVWDKFVEASFYENKLKSLEKTFHDTKSVSLNLSQKNTFEFRWFEGSFDPDTVEKAARLSISLAGLLRCHRKEKPMTLLELLWRVGALPEDDHGIAEWLARRALKLASKTPAFSGDLEKKILENSNGWKKERKIAQSILKTKNDRRDEKNRSIESLRRQS